MADQNNIIKLNFDGKETEYDVGKFDDKQKRTVLQIQDLQAKIGQLEMQVDQLRPSYDFFVNQLIESVKETKEAG